MPPAVAEPVFKPRQVVLDLRGDDLGEIFRLQCPLVLGAIARLSIGRRKSAGKLVRLRLQDHHLHAPLPSP